MPPSSSRSLSSAPVRFRAARAVLRLLLGTVFQVRAEGLDRLPPGPYVLASNHLSWVDPFLLLAWLPASPRVHFLGRRGAIYNRLWKRWLLALMGGIIPVDSGEIRHLSVAVRGVLQHGGVAAIFPEGAVGTMEGELQPLRRGVAHFAGDSSVPVVVVGIAGTRELWRGKSIALRIGATVQPTHSLDRDMAAIEGALRAALPPYRESQGARRPWPWLTTLLR
jgi:1-acyl-sn-glycerol-3-phosphate acyltransferase